VIAKQSDLNPAGDRRSGTFGRWFRRVALAAAVALFLSEAGLRFVAGLGDPPLYEVHPTIEYLMKPGVYWRFGNLVSVNSAGMRSPESVVAPPAPGTRRVLVVGDSIVNGGSLTDNSALATAALAVQLSVCTPTSVCNISAGSWGPGNWLAFFKERGTFSASFAVLVLNDGDATDAPTFAPLGPEHPTSRPLFASWEALRNYLPRYVPWLRPAPPIARGARVVDPLDDLSDGIELLRKSGVATCAVLIPSESELSAGPGKGFVAIRARLESLDVPLVDASDLLRSALRRGEAPFRDGVHLTAGGQSLLAEACMESLGMVGVSDQRPASSAVP
jgi:hypothetical protein